MIYFVTTQGELYPSDKYTIITAEKSLEIMEDWKVIQFDTETSGLNCHLDTLLTMQFGSSDGETQIVVDCTTIDPTLYKSKLESAYLEGQNLKFDLQFLYLWMIK